MRPALIAAACALSLLAPPAAAAAPEPAAQAAPPAKPAPYALPFMLRPLTAGNVVRLDTVFAFAEPRTTVPVLALGSYKVLPELAAIVRLGVIHNAPTPETPAEQAGTSFINPAIGALYAIPISDAVKASLFLATTLPVGTGGGDEPHLPTRKANLAGIYARASMDNALFQVNYLTPIAGAGIGYIADGLTLQAEATLLQLIRVRGAAQDKDAARTNLTAGLHFGFFMVPQLSLGMELRYQVWLANPTIEADPDDSKRDNWVLGLGPRGHFKLGEKVWVRPAVSLSMGLDSPTGFSGTGQEYKLLQVDVPVSF